MLNVIIRRFSERINEAKIVNFFDLINFQIMVQEASLAFPELMGQLEITNLKVISYLRDNKSEIKPYLMKLDEKNILKNLLNLLRRKNTKHFNLLVQVKPIIMTPLMDRVSDPSSSNALKAHVLCLEYRLKMIAFQSKNELKKRTINSKDIEVDFELLQSLEFENTNPYVFKDISAVLEIVGFFVSE